MKKFTTTTTTTTKEEKTMKKKHGMKKLVVTILTVGALFTGCSAIMSTPNTSTAATGYDENALVSYCECNAVPNYQVGLWQNVDYEAQVTESATMNDAEIVHRQMISENMELIISVQPDGMLDANIYKKGGVANGSKLAHEYFSMGEDYAAIGMQLGVEAQLTYKDIVAKYTK